MSKVKKEIVQAAILKLVHQITNTMPSSAYQFIFGGATTFATLKSSQKIDEMLSHISDENGLVDVELLEKLVDGSFNASNGKVQFDLFNEPSILNFFVKPITVTIQKSDILSLIEEIKANAVSSEVTLSEVSAKV